MARRRPSQTRTLCEWPFHPRPLHATPNHSHHYLLGTRCVSSPLLHRHRPARSSLSRTYHLCDAQRHLLALLHPLRHPRTHAPTRRPPATSARQMEGLHRRKRLKRPLDSIIIHFVSTGHSRLRTSGALLRCTAQTCQLMRPRARAPDAHPSRQSGAGKAPRSKPFPRPVSRA